MICLSSSLSDGQLRLVDSKLIHIPVPTITASSSSVPYREDGLVAEVIDDVEGSVRWR